MVAIYKSTAAQDIACGLMRRCMSWLGRNTIGAWLAVGTLAIFAPPGDGPKPPTVEPDGTMRMTLEQFKAYQSAWIAIGEKRAWSRMEGLTTP